MEARTGPGGVTLYLDSEDAERGSEDAFLHVYEDGDGDERWGYFCVNCDTFDTAVDPMGRIECNRCGNRHAAEEWDAAHE